MKKYEIGKCKYCGSEDCVAVSGDYECPVEAGKIMDRFVEWLENVEVDDE